MADMTIVSHRVVHDPRNGELSQYGGRDARVWVFELAEGRLVEAELSDSKVIETQLSTDELDARAPEALRRRLSREPNDLTVDEVIAAVTTTGAGLSRIFLHPLDFP